MPSTYTLIKGETLASSAASYTFTAIPSTFTDLVVRISGRDNTGGGSINNYAALRINSITSNYSETYLYGSGTSPSTGRFNAMSDWLFGGGWLSSAGGTSNTFSNTEIYIPNYAGSTNKVASNFTVQENNTSGSNQVGVEALLLGNTAAITSLLITPSGASFVTGSSFYLYGIKNS
jgi:hypothetical protein